MHTSPVPSGLEHRLRRLKRKKRFKYKLYLIGAISVASSLFLPLWLERENAAPLIRLFGLPSPASAQGGAPLVVITRAGPLTYNPNEQELKTGESSHSGFAYDLANEFARSQGWRLRMVTANKADVIPKLDAGEAHLAAAWLGENQLANGFARLRSATPYMHTQDVLVQQAGSLPIRDLSALAGKTVHVLPASRQIRQLHKLQEQQKNFKIVSYHEGNELELMQAISTGRVKLALLDEAWVNIGLNHYPELRTTLKLGNKSPIGWLFPDDQSEILYKANAFITEAKKDGLLSRLRERYLGHIEGLKPLDLRYYIARIHKLLPRYRRLFEQAQVVSGIDWRLLAALSYQESHWNPLATSPTGVRGIMMLTEDTADLLKVNNRLDPKQAIPAAARYLEWLMGRVEDAPPPDRYWLALASYNIGPGHLRAARRLARKLGKDPNSWLEMRGVLPLLSKPKYYARLSTGRARGGEAVILTENVRVYYDILQRRMPPYRPPHS